jgi:hypothetical protein
MENLGDETDANETPAKTASHSPLGGQLSARQSDSILRPEGFDLAERVFREQIFQLGVQHVGQHEKLQIRNTAVLGFQPGNGVLAGVPTGKLQFHGELVLRPSLLLAELPHLCADDIQFGDAFFDGLKRNSRRPLAPAHVCVNLSCVVAAVLEIFP